MGPKEQAKVCLTKFAESVMTGYRQRIFGAIDERIKEVKAKAVRNEFMLPFTDGLEEAKSVIENLNKE